MNLCLKLVIMIEHKNDANTLFWHIVYASFWTKDNLSHFLWNLKDPVLVQTLSNSRKITYYPLLIGGFFNAGYWAYVAFTCSSNNSFHHSNAPVSYLLPLTKMLSWTNNFHLLFIYKQNIARLSSTPDLRTKQRQRSLTHIFHSIHNNQSSTKDTVWQ